MTIDIVGIGEILVDFVATQPISLDKVSEFKKCFGGAPMNTLVAVSRLSSKSGAISVVGEDPFGQFLIHELEKNNVDVSHIKIKKGTRTTITFIANEPKTGERSFVFYRKPWIKGTADSELLIEDNDLDYISKTKILHVSGFSLSQNTSRKSVFRAVEYAKQNGVKVSFDPTLRIDVWSSKHTLRRLYNKMLKLSDIATFSKEEAEFIFKTLDPKKAAKAALRYGVEFVGIKLGSDGALLCTGSGEELYSSAFNVDVVDTTGAGDGWNAGLLVGLVKGWDLQTCLTVANAVGALVTTKHGAIRALPYINELRNFLLDHEVNSVV